MAHCGIVRKGLSVQTRFLSFKIDLANADGQSPQIEAYVVCVCWSKYILLFGM